MMKLQSNYESVIKRLQDELESLQEHQKAERSDIEWRLSYLRSEARIRGFLDGDGNFIE